MFDLALIRRAASAALPIVMGYVAIGLPCGILSASVGLNPAQVLIMCLLFYSGAGQFMIPNLWLAGVPLLSIAASVSLVNARQILYSASLASWAQGASRPQAVLFSATVTDESFGVNMNRFLAGGWGVEAATWVNICSWLTWTAACVVGTLIGGAVSVPLALASFAMTSIFICLLATQRLSWPTAFAMAGGALGVIACKAAGLAGPAIFVGSLVGVVCALTCSRIREVVR
ncbi:branched-chain amino acid ABC transporter permease [Eggerthellaceae bacterium zg-1084]|uniref:AzlC family ABC transporter permease n=1 Tax=Berryella wangjianweii TaxID=2734634 RepID=UPI0015522F40|nr:AzlC family ABC transporter permease [Berryella wangjianweii]NPD31266.1 branched-chain amino acid ABC transporter permease [Berryella wangjianweii]NPD32425.1 branched-chain amino acid ABC transporter permease [Eggerthellaceae bacterium zg-997]